MTIGIGCPGGGRFHMHATIVRNCFGWAVYLGPFYILRSYKETTRG